MNTPLVSCIAPVKPGHERYIAQSIQCFMDQTYPNRELIVGYSETCPVDQLVKLSNGYGWPSKLLMRYTPSSKVQTVGKHRNLLCDLARGEIIVHWDIDDWSAPDRVTRQVELLTPAYDVVGMRSMQFWDERSREVWHWAGPHNTNLGTSLCYRRSWWAAHPFSEIKIYGEDAEFINEAINTGRYRATLNGDLIIARSHNYNTSTRHYGGKGWIQTWWVNALPEGFRKVEGI